VSRACNDEWFVTFCSWSIKGSNYFKNDSSSTRKCSSNSTCVLRSWLDNKSDHLHRLKLVRVTYIITCYSYEISCSLLPVIYNLLFGYPIDSILKGPIYCELTEFLSNPLVTPIISLNLNSCMSFSSAGLMSYSNFAIHFRS